MVKCCDVIPLACDHAGFELKEYLKKALTDKGFEIKDMGTYSSESVDYPDFVHPLAKAVNDGVYRFGIVMCGTANGVSMVANKYSNVRCAICWNEEIAKLAKNHNNANIMALPARFVTEEEALKIITCKFLSVTPLSKTAVVTKYLYLFSLKSSIIFDLSLHLE